MSMDYKALLLLRKLQAMAAAGTVAAGSVTGTVPAKTVEPAPEPLVENMEKAAGEDEMMDIENQVNQAISDMEEGKAPVVFVGHEKESGGNFFFRKLPQKREYKKFF